MKLSEILKNRKTIQEALAELKKYEKYGFKLEPIRTTVISGEIILTQRDYMIFKPNTPNTGDREVIYPYGGSALYGLSEE